MKTLKELAGLAVVASCAACVAPEPQPLLSRVDACGSSARTAESETSMREQLLAPPSKGDPYPAPPSGAVVVRPAAARPMPDYPSTSLRCGEEGDVGVTMCIGPDGVASDIVMTRPSPHPRLNEATLRWARAGRHTPGTVDGAATGFCGITYVAVFRLQDQSLTAQPVE